LVTCLLTDESPKSTCPFTFYAQLHPVNVPEDLMQELEEETQRPTGIWTVSPPKLSLTGLLISKECGIMYQVVKTEGLRYVHHSLECVCSPSGLGRSRTFFRKVTTCKSLRVLFLNRCDFILLQMRAQPLSPIYCFCFFVLAKQSVAALPQA
jgi:hypothetical protein